MKRFQLKPAKPVRSDVTYVAGLQAEPGEGGHRSGGLAARSQQMLYELNLGVEFRVVRHQDEVVERVQTEGNGIEGLSRRNVDAELHAFDNWIRLASVACRSEPHWPGLWARLLVINRTSTRRF